MRAAVLPALLVLSSLPALAAEPAKTSCVACHGDPALFDEAKRRIVSGFGQDVHAQVGLSCQDCHGGNPEPNVREDVDAAMDKGFKANPYRGAPASKDVPQFCARCHSDPVYMRRFSPRARVDQEKEYWTSQHGRALKNGDTQVATCIDCHGVHGIRRPSDPGSPVYPTQVALTCRRCHEDGKRMAGRKTLDGRPLPVDQYAHWRQSVHAQALLGKGDLSAPTCNDCHGNHGATPPGLASVGLVCGQCHGREEQLFRASPKHAGFEAHAGFMSEAGARGCATCHESPMPRLVREASPRLGECVSCHGNHGVVRPTVALLAPLPATPCVFCHEPPESVARAVPEPEAKLRNYQRLRDALLEEARFEKVAGPESFDWLVDRTLALPTHTQASAPGQPLELRPEFARLFAKFRIGKTYYVYDDPVTGKAARAPIVRCDDCHTPDSEGLKTAAAMLDRMRELTGLTARAERILLSARHGGVETRDALLALDHAVDGQIELEALVHTFSSDAGSAFALKHRDGIGEAQSALGSGQKALEELGHRRRGLLVSLLFVLLVLVGLALKIRELSAREPES